MLDLNTTRGMELQKHFASQGGKAFFYRCDVKDQAECKRVVDQFATEHCEGRGITTLFNNAATFLCKGIEATTADFQHALLTNVAGYAHMVQAVHPHMLAANKAAATAAAATGSSASPSSSSSLDPLVRMRQNRCAIINNSSTSASRPQMSHWTYSSSKGGIKQLTRCMALDFGAQHIRVNSISPSWTWSPEVMKAAKDGGKEKFDPIWGKFHVSPRQQQ